MGRGPLSLFVSYAHEDEAVVAALRRHLAPLGHEGVIDAWHDRDLDAGESWRDQISVHLENADLVLAVLSSDFVSSDFAYGRELERALQLHHLGRLTLIPVIARACHWEGLPIGQLQALPEGARAISSWDDPDAAYVSVVRGVESIAKARLEQGTSLVDEWLTSRLIRRRVIMAVQQRLQATGLDPGPIDGIPGAMTERAVRAFQSDHELPVDGMIGPDVIRHLDEQPAC